MPESNGNSKIDDHAERLAKLEAARKEIEDSLLVMSVLEAKSATRIKEHAQFISAMEAGIKSHELRMAKQEETSDLLGQRGKRIGLGHRRSDFPYSAGGVEPVVLSGRSPLRVYRPI